MIVTPLHTHRVEPNQETLLQLLDRFVPDMPEHSVLAVTSKVVSMCEGAVVPLDSIDRDELIRREAEQYVDLPKSEYPITFTVVQNTLIPNAGVDESNTGDVYVLWPRDAQATANAVRAYVCKRFGLTEVGVVITDSTARPLRWGMGGIAIAHSGFKEVHDYRGESDLFNRQFVMETAAISNSLATAAVLVMGEGAESTPLALVTDVPFVEFQDRDPLPAELEELKLSVDDDLYSPIWQAVPWRRGGGGKQR
jgi:F420-0:gamma-glutamyl ligase